VRHYAVVSSLKIKPWRYVLMTPLPTFTGRADNLRLVWVLISIIVAALTIMGVLIMARGFTRPIIQLTQVADRITHLTQYCHFDERSEEKSPPKTKISRFATQKLPCRYVMSNGVRHLALDFSLRSK
jgi:hypothetical protein